MFRHSFQLGVFGLLFNCLVNFSVFSEETLEHYTLSLNELMESNVTGATLTEKRLMQVPASVTVFNREEISHLGLNTLQELMNFVPGFQSIRQAESSMHTSYSARARRIGTTGREILVLLNGMRIDNSWSGGLASTTPELSLDAISRIEFIRGPGSAIYGSNAFLGVINMVTEVGELDSVGSVGFSERDLDVAQPLKSTLGRSNTNRLSASLGSHKHRKIFAQGATDWSNLIFSSFFNYTEDKGQRYTVFDGYTNSRTMIRDPRQSLEFGLKVKHPGQNDNYWFEIFHSNKQGDDFYISDTIGHENNTSRFLYTNAYLAYQVDVSNRFEMQLKLGFRTWEQNIGGQATAVGALEAVSIPSSREPLLAKATLKDDENWLKIDNNWQAFKDGSFQFGVEFRHVVFEEAFVSNNFDLASLVSQTFPIPFFGDEYQTTPISVLKDQDIFGLYVQYQQTLSNQIEVIAGFRGDDYQHIGSNLSPRLGVVFPMSDANTIKLLYGEAFRSPNNAELYAINNSTVMGNAALKPEIVKTWELLWLIQNDKMTMNVGYFDNNIHDAIVQKIVAPIRRFVNGDSEKSSGTELEFSYQFNGDGLIKFNYSRFFDKPESAFRESSNLFSTIVNYQPGNFQFNIAAYYHGASQKLIDEGKSYQNMDNYWLANVKLGYQISPKTHMSMTIKNALDKDFFTPSQGDILGEGAPNRSRRFYVELEYFY